MDAILKVLEKLLARTNEGKISWKTTVDEYTYVAVVGNASVAITRLPLAFTEYKFPILDEAGIELESVSSTQSGDMFQELYDQARRFARGTETKLEALLTELDQV